MKLHLSGAVSWSVVNFTIARSTGITSAIINDDSDKIVLWITHQGCVVRSVDYEGVMV